MTSKDLCQRSTSPARTAQSTVRDKEGHRPDTKASTEGQSFAASPSRQARVPTSPSYTRGAACSGATLPMSQCSSSSPKDFSPIAPAQRSHFIQGIVT
ncbi:hypothetical protein PCASD_07031 [Puccinia coronata f. sp. avenae]|uniref:Uncharacterized protein n=1 Tax=Puccinia coronata f. sp. avenae TaxID=200324 RepID=A0A2N5UZZ6_9BASI|nr:hypothetical protein PCASD_07031 [Puccinia coronata f. sp. avenae]